MTCRCREWARTNSKIVTEHHPNCSLYNPEGDAKKIIEDLLKGVEAWASDEDGIHDGCWKAYEQAKKFVYQPLNPNHANALDSAQKAAPHK